MSFDATPKQISTQIGAANIGKRESRLLSISLRRPCAEMLTTLLCLCLTGSAGLASEIHGKVTAQGMRSPASIVVYVDAIPGRNFDPPSEHPVVNQLHMAFLPHVLPVVKGTTVEFRNDDPVNHNVFWPSVGGNKKLRYNLGTWAQGGMKSFTFNDLGAVPLLCFLHPEMSAYVIVTPTPYFAVTDDAGSFTIKNVPPGNYTLKTWSEEGKPVSQSLGVGDGEVEVNLVVKRQGM